MADQVDLLVNVTDNFIGDLTGIDYYKKTSIHSIVGFHVLGLDNEDKILFRGLADFINVDNKSNKLIVNTYFGKNEGVQYNKLAYCYEILSGKDQPMIDDGSIIFKNEYAFIEYSDEYLANNSRIKPKLFTSLKDLRRELKNDFRIAFEINGTTVTSTGTKAYMMYKALRPVIDIHALKVFVNLISLTQSPNGLFHTHDIGFCPQIDRTTSNPKTNKDHAVPSLTRFYNYNSNFNLKPAEVCYEDWNLLNASS